MAGLKRPFRVAVEGNISAGKSSFLEYFKRYSNIDTYTEPISTWTNFKGNNLLELLYTDIKKWNFLFQNFVQLSRFKIQTSKPTNLNKNVQIFERTLQSNRFCFGKMAFEQGYLTHPEFLVNTKWYETLNELEDISVDLIVYVRCSPETCFHRLKIRNRTEETNVSLKYLQDVHEIHDRWLISPESEPCAPVLVLDAEKDINELVLDYEKYKEYILGEKIYPSNIKYVEKTYPVLTKPMKNYQQICVEGNLSSGKSILLQNLQDNSLIECIQEPIDNWRDLEGFNLLKLLYSDLKRWNFLFRSYVQLTFLQSHIKQNLNNTNNCKLFVMERSLYSNRYVFIEHAHKFGYLTKAEYDTLIAWFDVLIERCDVNIDHIVYIQSSPTLCLERLKKRGRPEEDNIPLEYLQQLHDFHEKWLTQSSINHTPLFIIDSHRSEMQLVKDFEKRFIQNQK
ncbi:uncharacterized protein LOC123295306 [Chrysoperla carnea]|uniref:uncharacterized protein LOC123295306 n=1 Tax=Chrysoperla carnea TaxID=189513 RepID=UPI001D06F40E|nr:uncharacterized protein LOC123295306 [Chrysoperla carnea]